MPLLQEIAIFLTAALLLVPLFKRLGLGSVLGYLMAGVLIGPAGLGLVWEVKGVMHVAEFGVVLLLFIIGLELQPSRLWQMRRAVFGLGLAQVGLSTLVLAGLGLAIGVSAFEAWLLGMGLSLSSTAFALQLLAEKNQLTLPHGRAAFGILLFQDLAVIPVLALLPLFAQAAGPASADSSSLLWSAAKLVGVLGLVGLSKFAIRPIFRAIAQLQMQELFTACALLVVIGTALLVSSVGLSMALGAFLAGVLLADSEYRHELEADIEPFKGLLLGLFFIAVGMSLDLGVIAREPAKVAGLVVGLVAVKALVLFGIGRWALGSTRSAGQLALVLAEGGEFAFVLFGLAVRLGLLEEARYDLVVAAVSLSMALTPLLMMLQEAGQRRRRKGLAAANYDVAPSDDNPVIIAGFGRVGQIVGRVLRARKIPFTALDKDPAHIAFVGQFGNKVFFGDASRLDLLRAAKADKAQVFVLAIDDTEASLAIARTVLQHFPHLQIVARARNRTHAYNLMNLGIKQVWRETFAASLEMSEGVLTALGSTFSESRSATQRFREHDERLMESTYQFKDDPQRLRAIAVQARLELESLFASDAAQ